MFVKKVSLFKMWNSNFIMDTNEEILKEESLVGQLRNEARRLVAPRKSINFQFQNLRYGNRNQTQRAVITRRKRQKVLRRIASSQERIDLLRQTLIPVQPQTDDGII